jgi:hypothetical protein
MFSIDQIWPAGSSRRPPTCLLTALLHGPLGNSRERYTHAGARWSVHVPGGKSDLRLRVLRVCGILFLCRPLRPVQVSAFTYAVASFSSYLNPQRLSAAVEPATRPGVLAGRSARRPGCGAGASLGAA